MSLNFKAYVENVPEDMILRDHLAFDRTILANERTVLAYVRTVIACFVSGLTFIKLFPSDKTLVIIGYTSMIAALLIGIVGVKNYIKFQKKISKVYEPWDEGRTGEKSKKKRDPLI